jgi:thioredoxin-dependent peroxiredoxin
LFQLVTMKLLHARPLFLSLLALTAGVRGLTSNHPQKHVSRRGVFSKVLQGAVVAVVANVPTRPALALPETGVTAPAFDLPNSRGEGTTSLQDLIKTGKWTVLYFYPGAFTSGCTLEARYFQRDMDQYRTLNAQIVGVSVDPVEKNAQFCSAENLDFFMLSDRGGMVSQKYGSALSIPGFGTFSNRQTYLIDPKGELKWIFNDVESHIPRHSEEVLAKLKDLEAAV